MNELSADAFRKACGYWATGVSIVTTCDLDGRPYGLTMNAVTSLSLAPPQFLICLDGKSDTLEPMRRSGAFCINVLSSGQQALSNAFAKKGPNKFDGVAYTAGPAGAPRLSGHLLAIDCKVSATYPGGDHLIVVGDVVDVSVDPSDEAAPLLYYRGRYALLGG